MFDKAVRPPRRCKLHALAMALLTCAGLMGSAHPALALQSHESRTDLPQSATSPASAIESARDTDEAAQRQRQVLMGMIRATAQRDEVVERVTGFAPSSPKFAVLKAGLLEIYNDDAVLGGILDSIDANGEFQRERFAREWGRRLVSGMNRLDDRAALDLLRSVGVPLARLDEQQCSQYMTDRKSNQGSFDTALMRLMDDDDIRLFFGTLHSAFRADTEKRPMRPIPSSQEMNAVMSLFAKAEQEPAFKARAKNPCAAALLSVQIVEQTEPALRPAAITAMLTMAGFYAQKATTR